MKQRILARVMARDIVRANYKITIAFLFFLDLMIWAVHFAPEVAQIMTNYILLMVAFAFIMGTMIAATRYLQLGLCNGMNRRAVTVAMIRALVFASLMLAVLITANEGIMMALFDARVGIVMSLGFTWPLGLKLMLFEALTYLAIMVLIFTMSLLMFGITLRLQRLWLSGLIGGGYTLLLIGGLGSQFPALLRMLVGHSQGRFSMVLACAAVIAIALTLGALRVWNRVDLQGVISKS